MIIRLFIINFKSLIKRNWVKFIWLRDLVKIWSILKNMIKYYQFNFRLKDTQFVLTSNLVPSWLVTQLISVIAAFINKFAYQIASQLLITTKISSATISSILTLDLIWHAIALSSWSLEFIFLSFWLSVRILRRQIFWLFGRCWVDRTSALVSHSLRLWLSVDTQWVTLCNCCW